MLIVSANGSTYACHRYSAVARVHYNRCCYKSNKNPNPYHAICIDDNHDGARRKNNITNYAFQTHCYLQPSESYRLMGQTSRRIKSKLVYGKLRNPRFYYPINNWYLITPNESEPTTTTSLVIYASDDESTNDGQCTRCPSRWKVTLWSFFFNKKENNKRTEARLYKDEPADEMEEWAYSVKNRMSKNVRRNASVGRFSEWNEWVVCMSIVWKISTFKTCWLQWW